MHDLCKEAREDYSMEAEVRNLIFRSGMNTNIVLLKVELEAEDYDYSFGAPSMSNYSTLGTLDTRYWPA